MNKPEDLRISQVEEYIKLIEEGVNIVYLVSDSISTSKTTLFAEKFPERFINVGIAEQNLIGIASGLANGGFIPVTGNASPFLISRSNEQLKVDASYSNANIKINGMHAGFSYGLDGITHHEVNDISTIRGFPSFEIYIPIDPLDCKLIIRHSVLDKIGPTYTSFNSGNFPVICPQNHTFKPGDPIQFREGSDLTIIALGTAIHDALIASESIKHKISSDIFAINSIRPFHPEKLVDSIRKTGKVITIEQHSTHGGIGSKISETITDLGLHARLFRLGIPEGHFTKNWTAQANKEFFKLDPKGIIEVIMNNFIK